MNTRSGSRWLTAHPTSELAANQTDPISTSAEQPQPGEQGPGMSPLLPPAAHGTALSRLRCTVENYTFFKYHLLRRKGSDKLIATLIA